MIKLYSYFRSSASFRVRIALELKGLPYEIVPVNLRLQNQQDPSFRHVNPQGFVPVLMDGTVALHQSMAILEYVDEVYPHPPLLPRTPQARGRVRAIAQMIMCDIHPLNNLRVLNYCATVLKTTEETKMQWYHHWIHEGFQAIESLVDGSPFCCGHDVTIADLTLIPQVYNAQRFQVDLSLYPKIQGIYQHCMSLKPFQIAAPESQVDFLN